jgi:hypothetical protein
MFFVWWLNWLLWALGFLAGNGELMLMLEI